MNHSFKRMALLGASAATALGVLTIGPAQSYDWNDDRSNDQKCSETDGYSSGSYGGDELYVVGLATGGRLICFGENDPENASTIGTIRGLQGDSLLVGIDYRPANGRLYGLGNNGGIYTINDDNAHATFVSRITVALQGGRFGVDFNPVVDRLRVISETGQNLRVVVETGANTVDGNLAYPPAMPGQAPTPGMGVTGAAYTNNDSDPNTATTRYDIDTMMDQVSIQSPANSGQLAATGKLTVSSYRRVGSDIYSTLRNGKAVALRALATLEVGGRTSLYGITLFNGEARSRGNFPSGTVVTGIAIPLNQL